MKKESFLLSVEEKIQNFFFRISFGVMTTAQIIMERVQNYNHLSYFPLLTQYYAGDKIEKNEMGRACGTYGGRKRCAHGFGGET